MNDTELMDRTRLLNPAPTSPLTAAELRSKDELAARFAGSTAPGRIPSRRPRRRVPLLIAAACATLIVAGGVASLVLNPSPSTNSVALASGALSASEIAQWTNAPSPLTPRAAVAEICAQRLDRIPAAQGQPATILNGDLRGDVGSVIVQKGEEIAWCVGNDETPTYLMLAGAGRALPAAGDRTVVLGPNGAHIPPNGYGFAAGTAGKDVAGLVLHEDGLNVVATVANGYWSAWWPSDDETSLVEGTFTVETSDGTSTTYKAADLRAPE